ncbi:MAG: LysM domain-containing protein [Thermoleophilaceae bacterium]
MQEPSQRNPARLIAPAALAAVALVFFIVLLSSGSGDGGSHTGSQPSAKREKARSHQAGAPVVRKASYTVKTGDTLGGIANKTGVPVDKLLELNPQLDPQALVSGQKIKLRE